jgi:hypothetical protein
MAKGVAPAATSPIQPGEKVRCGGWAAQAATNSLSRASMSKAAAISAWV